MNGQQDTVEVAGHPGERSDRDIMAALAAGDSAALGALYLRYAGLVRCAIARCAPEMSIGEVDEQVQEVFLTAARRSRDYVESDRLRAWLYGIGARTARSWRRNTWLRRRLLKGREGEPVGMAAAVSSSPEQQVGRREEILQLLARLPAVQREVLLLHAVDGWSGEEIAQMLGITHEAVRTRLFRARQAMMAAADAGLPASFGRE